MTNCQSCLFWFKLGAANAPRRIVYDSRVMMIAAGDEGQCRAHPPCADNRWPLTMQGDWCGKFRDRSQPSTLDAGQPGDAPPEDSPSGGSGNRRGRASGQAKQ